MPQADQSSPSPAQLKALESELKKGQAENDKAAAQAAAEAHDAESLRGDMVNTATAIQENEEALSDLETQLKSLDEEERSKTEALDLRRQQMNGTITALARLAFRPTEAVIGQPTSPADTVRSAILLREEVPRLRQAAEELRTELDAVAQVRTAIATQKQRIAATSAKLDGDHRHLSSLYAKKAEARDQAEAQSHETAERVAALAVQAQDIRDLLARIEIDKAEREKAAREQMERAQRDQAEREQRERAEREQAVHELAEQAKTVQKPEQTVVAMNAPLPAPAHAPAAKPIAAAPPPQAPKTEAPRDSQPAAIHTAAPRSFTQAQGHMPYPARGPLAIRFGQMNETGMPARGVTIETRPGAQVVAPYDGEVAFAGPFRGYGLLLIIEHTEGYHTLLAGMARIDSAVGQRLVAGEPVGVMEAASEDKPLLYFELRRQGQPINPLPWLSAHTSKVSE
jgi:septal ring factor EnvC (AmiA/AmiB activator)